MAARSAKRWQRGVSLVLVLLSLSCGAASAQEDAAEARFHQAEAADKAGDEALAVDLYTRFVMDYPNVMAGHANLGVVLAHAGKLEEAAAQYRQALSLAPGNSVVTTDLAIVRYKQGHYDEAAKLLKPIVEAHPAKGQALYLLADCYMRKGSAQEVVRLLTPFFDQDPSNRSVNYLLGRALLDTGDMDKGSRVIDRVMRDGNPGEADLLIGARLLAAAQYPAAEQTLRKATQENPRVEQAWCLYGRALLNTAKFEPAKEAFLQALALDANDFEANLYLGGMLRQQSAYTAALPYLQKAWQLRADSPQAMYQMGAVESSLGHWGEAIRYLEPLTRQWPNFKQSHAQLANAYQKLGRVQESRAEWKKFADLDDKERQPMELPEASPR